VFFAQRSLVFTGDYPAVNTTLPRPGCKTVGILYVETGSDAAIVISPAVRSCADAMNGQWDVHLCRYFEKRAIEDHMIAGDIDTPKASWLFLARDMDGLDSVAGVFVGDEFGFA
jgi:hypothetical protein